MDMSITTFLNLVIFNMDYNDFHNNQLKRLRNERRH